MSAEQDALREAFARFAAAVEQADLEAYRALAVLDAPPQEALFSRNAQKVREAGWKLSLRALELTGEVGEARFDLVDAKGTRVDEGTATFTLEPDGWRLRAL